MATSDEYLGPEDQIDFYEGEAPQHYELALTIRTPDDKKLGVKTYLNLKKHHLENGLEYQILAMLAEVKRKLREEGYL